jgi:hypothetical protein
MIARASFPGSFTVAATLAALALCVSLGGCAGVGDSFASAAFVDPAKYDLFDCKQLEAERKLLAVRTAELQGLIDKAQTGTGGAVVSELAYRNDYISARGSARLAGEVWQRDKCVASPLATMPAPDAPAAGNAPRTGAKRSSRAVD